jgi:hypothetical protein
MTSGGESRGHVGFEVAARFVLLPAGQLLPATEDDATGRQKRDEVPAMQSACWPICARSLSRNCSSSSRSRLGLPVAEQGMRFMKNSSRFEREDREEFHPLEQRRALVECLGQNARVEIEPAQIAVDPHVGQHGRQRRVQDSVIPD